MKDFSPDDAMGVYPISRNNRDKLRACFFKEVLINEQLGGVIFVFYDPYRQLQIDLLFTGAGELLLSDYYGESMKRENIYYLKISG